MAITKFRGLIIALATESMYGDMIALAKSPDDALDACDKQRGIQDEIHATDGVAWLRLRYEADGMRSTFREWLCQQRAKLCVEHGLAERTVDSMSVADVAAKLDGKPSDQSPGKLVWLANAMLLVKEHPEWSDTKIARTVGKSPSTLSRSTEFQTAANMARGAKSDIGKGAVTINGKSRDIEAYDYSSDPAKMDWDT